MTAQGNESYSAKGVIDVSFDFSRKTLQDYEVISVIGNGAFGTCFKVRDKENGKLYVWKSIDYDELSELQKEALISEIKLLRQLQHPNIVQYFHYLVNFESKSIFIVMECCEGGDLAQLIAKAKAENKRFEERYIWRVLFQVCRALQLCHNKIRDGTILHRDIKPANIFLDMEGNSKIGDFGLARMLTNNEKFAMTFVGTPYYMSPEIIRGLKYDRKSDVWAVGCLTYEMCSLRPPFKGKEFDQLSANISIGKFSSIPNIYSEDLQEIIEFMLEVESDQRPCIEIILRHPLLVRNINNLGNEFPILVDIEMQHQNFYVDSNSLTNTKSPNHLDFSSTMFSEQKSLSISGVFTPDLKDKLFYSSSINSKCQISDPELYEAIKYEMRPFVENTCEIPVHKQTFSENEAIEFEKKIKSEKAKNCNCDNIFRARLEDIKKRETILVAREKNLNEREKELNEKEKHLLQLEEDLVSRCQLVKKECNKIKLESTNEKLRLSLPSDNPNLQSFFPYLSHKKATKHDDTYCTIELNDISLLHEPTMAKLNMATLPAPKAFSKLRKVTFQSPKKFITYYIDNNTKKCSLDVGKDPMQVHSSISSKSSQESSQCAATTTSSCAPTSKHKSILSIFRFNRNNKAVTNSKGTCSISSHVNYSKAPSASDRQKTKSEKEGHPLKGKEENIISKCETIELKNIWTREHKKAAFEMLATINAGRGDFNNAPRHKIRHSAREHNTLQRNRVRRSLMVPTCLPTTHPNDRIVI